MYLKPFRTYLNEVTLPILNLERKDNLYAEKESTKLSPEDLKIDEPYQVKDAEGQEEEKIIFAISATKHDLNGFVVNKYGENCAFTTKMVRQL